MYEHSRSVPDPFAAYAAFAFGRLNILLFSSLRTKKCANYVRKHSVNKTIYKLMINMGIQGIQGVHENGHSGRFPFSQNFPNFRFGGKWNTFRRFVPLENSQKKWKI